MMKIRSTYRKGIIEGKIIVNNTPVNYYMYMYKRGNFQDLWHCNSTQSHLVYGDVKKSIEFLCFHCHEYHSKRSHSIPSASYLCSVEKLIQLLRVSPREKECARTIASEALIRSS